MKFVDQPDQAEVRALSISPISYLSSSNVNSTNSTNRLIQAFLEGRNAKTLLAYRQDLEDFRDFLGVTTFEAAAETLLHGGLGNANSIALGYRARLMDSGLAASTINRRLAALRSLVKLARTLGIVPWILEVKNLASQAYRDTRGPGESGIRLLLQNLGSQRGPKAARNRAILRLLHDLGLRRGEVVSLHVGDVDLEQGTIAILGKGRTQKEMLTLPLPTKQAIQNWLVHRKCNAGPLFINFDRAKKGNGLTGTSLYRIVCDLGKKSGIHARPHGIRHTAITTALDRTRGNIRAVQRFSRHKDPRTLQLYDDNRDNLGGMVAELVADFNVEGVDRSSKNENE